MIDPANASLPLLLPFSTKANRGCVVLAGTEFLRDPACGDVGDNSETGDAVDPCESRLDLTANVDALKNPSLKLSMYTGARPM
jgi:hypothetical protein